MSFRMRMAVRQQSRISSFGAGRTIGTKRNRASGCLCGKSRRVTNLIGQLNPWSDCLPSSATKARAAVGRSISSRYHAIGMRTVVFRESIVVEQHPIRARKFAALIVALTCLSCGGHSTPTAPASTVLDLVTGPYALTVTMSSIGDPICTKRCLPFRGTVQQSWRSADVAASHRCGPLGQVGRCDQHSSRRRLLLVSHGTPPQTNALSGTASGQLRDGNVQLSIVSAQGQAGAGVTGTVLAASVAGKIDGQVGIGGYSCSNNGHTWGLTRR